MIYLIINILIYIFIFLFQGNPGGDILDNLKKRNEMALLLLLLFNSILLSIIKGEKVNSWF